MLQYFFWLFHLFLFLGIPYIFIYLRASWRLWLFLGIRKIYKGCFQEQKINFSFDFSAALSKKGSAICREIVAKNRSEEEWDRPSDDTFERDPYAGSYDAAEQAFAFSYRDAEKKEWWLSFGLPIAEKIARGDEYWLDLYEPRAELIRSEATVCGRFTPVCKEARHGSQGQRLVGYVLPCH